MVGKEDGMRNRVRGDKLVTRTSNFFMLKKSSIKKSIKSISITSRRQNIDFMTANENSLTGIDKDRKCAYFQIQPYAKIIKFAAINVNKWQQKT